MMIFILHILSGFGSEFDVVVVNLTNRPDNLTLHEVQFAFQAHEIRLQNQSSFAFPSANIVYQKSSNRGFSSNFNQSGGRSYSHDNTQSQNGGGRSYGYRGRGGGKMIYRDN